MNIDIKKGDILLGGRFKNKRIEIKSLGTNGLGQYTVNKRPLLNYRIEKKLPKNKQSAETRKEVQMDKQAYLDSVYQKALIDELEKIAKRKNSFKVLQENKVPLTPEERNLVMQRKATWHHGPNGEETPAVWKSFNPKTKETTYITNTHRAYNTASTVKGAINRYHKFIKGTA